MLNLPAYIPVMRPSFSRHRNFTWRQSVESKRLPALSLKNWTYPVRSICSFWQRTMISRSSSVICERRGVFPSCRKYWNITLSIWPPGSCWERRWKPWINRYSIWITWEWRLHNSPLPGFWKPIPCWVWIWHPREKLAVSGRIITRQYWKVCFLSGIVFRRRISWSLPVRPALKWSCWTLPGC